MAKFYNPNTYKDYLLERQKNVRVKNDALWVNTIPLPLAILDDIFSLGDVLFTEYAESLLSAFLVARRDMLDAPSGDGLFILMPDPKIVELRRLELIDLFRRHREEELFRNFEHGVFDALGTEVRVLSESSFINALSHKGKKYQRLYYPEGISKYLDTHIPRMKTMLCKKNGDMFGNIVADTIGIYRNGFSDALSLIFNRFLDFKFEEFSGLSATISGFGSILASESLMGEAKLNLGHTINGALWEPRLNDDGDIISVLDKSHPAICPPSELDREQLFLRLVTALSIAEMSAVSELELQHFEKLRAKVSKIMRDAD